MHFLIDNQLPSVLAQWLRDRGHVAEHVREIGLNRAKDRIIWAHAVSIAAILLTKDEDFVSIRRAAPSGPAVVLMRIGNATNDSLFEWLEPRFDRIAAAVNAGATLIELT